MSKERFSDDTYDLAKALNHISIAKKYFEMIMVDKSYDTKMIFNQYVLKCDWIEKNIYDRLSPDSRKFYKESLIKGDTVFYDSVSEKLLHIDEAQKPLLEKIIDAASKNKTIEVNILY